MKKFVLLALVGVLAGMLPSMAMTYEEALNASKPMALLMYAPWADGVDTVTQNFNAMQQTYGSRYNFVKINIATAEAKTYNQKYHIYTNLPYVLLMRDRGKISRYLPKSCINETSCFQTKLDLFNN